jgi:hypothetical protein
MEKNKFEVKQELWFVWGPLIFDFLLFILAMFMSGFLKWIGIVISLGLAGLVLWQSRPMFKNYKLILTPKEIKILDFKGNPVRTLEYKKVVAAAGGVKKSWKIYTYNFYFRVKGDEDLSFVLISTEPNLTAKFQNFLRVFVRRKIPVQILKG